MRKISSLALFAFLLPLAGCPAGDDTETDTAVGTTTMTPATAGETAETAATAEETAATAAETAGTADSTAGGGGAGFCAQTCTDAAMCVPAMGDPADWACTDGFCEYVGEPFVPPPCDDTTCPAVANLACADVGGVNQCTTPCMDDTMCAAGFTECTGMDDNGNSICAPIPCFGAEEGAPCETMTGNNGICTDGVCGVCSDDTECTIAGQGCRPGE